MISVLFCSRAKDNPDSALTRLLDSAVACTTPEEQQQIEFLIKFDDDDEHRLPDAELTGYPFAVRPFCWSRGEGRHGLHNVQEYLFTQRDPRSRFLLMTADDFLFTRPGFVEEILHPALDEHDRLLVVEENSRIQELLAKPQDFVGGGAGILLRLIIKRWQVWRFHF